MNTLLPLFTDLRLRQILLICSILISTHVTADSAGDQRLSSLHTRSAAFPAINSHSEPALQGDGYGFVNDADSLLDNLKNIYDEGVALDGRSRGILVIPGDETELVEQLENADNDITSFAAGGHFALLTQDKNWVVVGGSEFNGSGRFIYDEGDANRLRFATILGLFSLGELQSSVNVSALWKNYLGLNYRFSLESMPNTQIGITAKLQNISVIEREISIEDYDEDKLFDRGRDVENSIQANADLGIEHQVDNWLFNLDFNDIYQQEIEGPEGTRYQQRTHISSSINYRANWASLRLDADLSPQKGFGELSSRRAYALSGLLPVSEKLQLLLGYTWLHSGNDSNLPTVGLHYRLGELLRIEAQFSYAGPREFGGGASLQLPL